jgi:hypothetical protein
MHTSLRATILTLPLAAALAGQSPATGAQDPVADLDRAVARCVLDHLPHTYGDEAVRLLRESCTALIEGGAGDAQAGEFLVRCRVAGDPEWIDFRLVTRSQCASANGRIDANP